MVEQSVFDRISQDTQKVLDIIQSKTQEMFVGSDIELNKPLYALLTDFLLSPDEQITLVEEICSPLYTILFADDFRSLDFLKYTHQFNEDIKNDEASRMVADLKYFPYIQHHQDVLRVFMYESFNKIFRLIQGITANDSLFIWELFNSDLQTGKWFGLINDEIAMKQYYFDDESKMMLLKAYTEENIDTITLFNMEQLEYVLLWMNHFVFELLEGYLLAQFRIKNLIGVNFK